MLVVSERGCIFGMIGWSSAARVPVAWAVDVSRSAGGAGIVYGKVARRVHNARAVNVGKVG